MLYEPVVDAENDDDVKAWQYIYERPTPLPKYLQEFKHKNDDSIDIVPGPAISTCPGIRGFTKSGSYLSFEGSEKCLLCDVSLLVMHMVSQKAPWTVRPSIKKTHGGIWSHRWS